MSDVTDSLAYKMFVATLEHPIVYANLLIEVGYKPPENWICTLSSSCSGQTKVPAPLFVRYINYIYKMEGLAGLANGLQPRLCLCLISSFTEKQILSGFQRLRSNKETSRGIQLIETLTKRILSRTVAIIIGQPFYVISIRTMAQFVGKETKYVGVWNSLKVVYSEQGLHGLFAGLAPRLVRDVVQIVLTTGFVFVVNVFVLHKNKPFEGNSATSITHEIASMCAKNLTYPLHVISTCMAVNDHGLNAGSPPLMPTFNSCFDCWNYLTSTSQLRRGLFPMWRYERSPNMFFKVLMAPCTSCSGDGSNNCDTSTNLPTFTEESTSNK